MNQPAQLELEHRPGGSPRRRRVLCHEPDADVEWLEHLLQMGRDWQTAAEILAAILRPPTDDNKRWLRDLASRSEWILSGQLGYKNLEHATAEEIDHAANWLISQGKKMIRRGIALRRNAHRIFG